MKSETLGIQKEFFEKEYGPAKKILNSSTYQYQVNSCFLNVGYNKANSITSIELQNISKECTFDAKNIFLSGSAHELTYKKLISGAMDWDAKISCYEFCGNAADPTYGIYVETPRVTQFIEYDAESNYATASKSSELVREHFKVKYPNFQMSGIELGPISSKEYNQVWFNYFKDIQVTSIKFGYQLKK